MHCELLTLAFDPPANVHTNVKSITSFLLRAAACLNMSSCWQVTHWPHQTRKEGEKEDGGWAERHKTSGLLICIAMYSKYSPWTPILDSLGLYCNTAIWAEQRLCDWPVKTWPARSLENGFFGGKKTFLLSKDNGENSLDKGSNRLHQSAFWIKQSPIKNALKDL